MFCNFGAWLCMSLTKHYRYLKHIAIYFYAFPNRCLYESNKDTIPFVAMCMTFKTAYIFNGWVIASESRAGERESRAGGKTLSYKKRVVSTLWH